MGFAEGIFTHALDAMLLAGDDARFVGANPAACELTGYDHDELLGLHVADLTEPADRAATEAQWERFLSEGRGEGTFTVRRRDGTLREVDFRAVAHVDPGIHLSIMRDVSEQRRAERATAQRDEWIDLILEQLPAALWIVDRRLRITFARGAADLTADLLARGPMQLEDVPTAGPPVLDAHRRALAGEEAQFEVVARSETVWHCHVEPLRRRGGTIVGVLGVGVEVTETVRIRDELEDTLRTVRQLERQRRRLARELRLARDEERRRIARELHDDLGQGAALMAVLARTLERDVPAQLAPRLAELHLLAQRTAQSTRHLIGQLRDEPADDLTLRASLHRLVREFEDRHGVALELSLSSNAGEVPVTVAAAAHRIAREAVTNAVKHATPTVISIVSRVSDDRLTLVIEDDGDGFDVSVASSQPSRYGITGMREQAAEAGGGLTLDSAPGKGTVIRAELPLDGG